MVNVKIDPTVARILNINIDKTGIPKDASIDKKTGDITLTLDASTLTEFGGLVDIVNQSNGLTIPPGAISLSGNSLIIRTELLKPALAGSSASNPHIIALRFANGQSILIKAYDGSVHIVSIATESPTILTAPTVSNITVDNFTVSGGILDKDGVSGIRYFVYTSNPATDKNAKILTTANASENGVTQITVGALDFTSVFVRASGLAKQGGKMVPVDSLVSEVKLLKPVTPDAPNCLGDDTTNTINCAAGTDTTKLEYSVDAGKTYAQFTKDLKFPGAQIVYIREKAAGYNPAGKITEIRFTVDPVKPSAPTCQMDDQKNILICGSEINPANLEVSVDGSPYQAFNANTVYPGSKTVLVRVKASGVNPPSDPTTFKFTNSAPVIEGSAVNVTMIAGTSKFIDAPKATDADGDTLIFSLSNAPQGVTISANGAILLPNTLTPGTYTFNRLVADGVNTPVAQSISVVVVAANVAPVIQGSVST
ncbi:MAG: hypothetical protein ACOYN2_05145, partial [Patescibacteria group bacterium]